MKLHFDHVVFRKAPWPAKTYRGRTRTETGRTYTVDHDGRTWTLRAWQDGTPVRVEGNTYGMDALAGDLMRLADEDARKAAS